MPLNVLEGSNVTLESGLKKLKKEHTVKWTQGDCGVILLAQLRNNETFINESFKDVVQLNQHTGFLTFIRVTKSFMGIYCVKVLWAAYPHPLKVIKYWIIVYGRCLISNILNVIY